MVYTIVKEELLVKIIELNYKDLPEFKEDISLLLGYFDGLHLGHLSLFRKAIALSNYPLGILTFSCPVSTFIGNGKSTKIITSILDKERILSSYPIENLYILKIDKDFVNLTPEEFIKILKKMNAKELFVGEDYRFGKGHLGNLAMLEKEFKLYVHPLTMIEDKKVSTSEIIKLIEDGNVEVANKMLNRYYEVKGHVVHGNHIGTQLKFPTANLELDENYVLPRFGVYKTLCYVNGVPKKSLTNIGVHPTIKSLNKPSIEIHIKDYDGDLYGKTIYLAFLEFIRPEKKFNSPEELKKQIENDMLLI